MISGLTVANDHMGFQKDLPLLGEFWFGMGRLKNTGFGDDVMHRDIMGLWMNAIEPLNFECNADGQR